jgi:hypothetical protein
VTGEKSDQNEQSGCEEKQHTDVVKRRAAHSFISHFIRQIFFFSLVPFLLGLEI